MASINNGNNLNLGMRCIKYMLFIINFMFVLTAMLLITVGSTIVTLFDYFSLFVDSHFMTAPTFMIVIGGFLLFVAVFGCIGGIKESTMLINIYGVFLAIVFIMEIVVAFSAYALHDQVNGMLRHNMNVSIRYYDENPQIAEAVDFMQTSLGCCGAVSRDDWHGVLPKPEGVDEGQMVVPASCCKTFFDSKQQQCVEYFERGCLDQLHFLIAQSAMLIATGATTVAFVQMLGVICAFMLAKTIRRTKTLRNARRWQVTQDLGILTKPEYNHTPYTQLEKTERSANDPVMYVASSPSVN